MRNITVQDFMCYLEARVNALPQGCVIKSIGTNQDNFIIYAQDAVGKEYKLYIPCEDRSS